MELKGLKIMVTGGAGFIGSHLVDKLIEMGNDVIVYDDLDEYYVGKEDNIQHNLGNSNFNFMKLDILNYDALCKAMKKVDVVFHLAAQPGVRYSLQNPQKTNTVNTTGTLNVLKAAKENRVKKVIFASSSAVYGIPQYMPIDEKHPTNPISIYGASKLAAEKFCQIYINLFDLSTIILRYHTVYGPRQRPDMAIYKWTQQLFENKPPVIYGDGEQTRDFTYIDDIMNGTLKAAETDDIEGEIFNLGSGSRFSVNEVLRLLQKVTQKGNGNPVHYAPKLGDVSDTYADITKAKKRLGYNPTTTLEDGIKRFIKWYKSRSYRKRCTTEQEPGILNNRRGQSTGS